ncbi:MAG: serine/threonine-protein kinase, partial [Gemmatimonadota bacterium]
MSTPEDDRPSKQHSASGPAAPRERTARTEHRREILAPELSTPTAAEGGPRSMPSDLLGQICRRVGVAGVVFAAVWTVVLLMQNVIWRLFEPIPAMYFSDVWPMPGNLIAGAGVALSLAMVPLANWLSERPHLSIRIGLGFEILTAALIASLNWQLPEAMMGIGISWVCIVVIAYPAIVPAAPGHILVASLIAASMDPLMFWLLAAGEPGVFADGFALTWIFMPNYICAFLAIVPAKVVRTLGQRVSRARELGSYRLEERLRSGGMGDVYRATHRLLARPAAIKLIRPEVLGASTDEAAEVIVERFKREARAAANLRSPNTIELYDFGTTADGALYYVMELLEGLDLQEMVERFGPLPAARAVHFLRQACLSLGEAHDRGLIHRDIKPSNLVAARLGLGVDHLKILDFGLVKADPAHDADQTKLTSPNVTAGTPAFMSPEVALGEGPVDRRADIYALGCVGYWLLTGKPVFEGATPVAVLMGHVRDDPVPPSQRSELDVPAELDEVILECLAKRPEDRPDTAMELYEDLCCIPVAPWNSTTALEWWSLHLPELVRTDP